MFFDGLVDQSGAMGSTNTTENDQGLALSTNWIRDPQPSACPVPRWDLRQSLQRVSSALYDVDESFAAKHR